MGGYPFFFAASGRLIRPRCGTFVLEVNARLFTLLSLVPLITPCLAQMPRFNYLQNMLRSTGFVYIIDSCPPQ